ncbi:MULTISPECIES: hypothetical protein [Actinoplanes]|uniref:hypothetical protein n=1 Tax=Actinoplanes TaxID=1865 RepID=UPI0005F2F7A9|nr:MULTISPECIES: hypothetical protein [Actinoplanes]GLY02703.1 hypothetical protein Acsp01_30820 [Actinoplanes sp. NBRC 101535]
MRRVVRYVPAGREIAEPVTKLSGQPVWLETPQWPISASRNRQMPFVGQFRLDDGTGEPRLAYVFMSDENIWDIEDEQNDDWDPDADDEDEVDEDEVGDTFDPEGGENAVIIQPGGRVPSFVTVRPIRTGPVFKDDHLPEDVPAADEESWQFLGGEPRWLQHPEPPGAGWRFVGQMTDDLGHNFGDGGIAYLFVSPDGAEGRFLWQC